MSENGISAILDFWFGGVQAHSPAERDALWWGGAADLDAIITVRFAGVLDDELHGTLAHWSESPRGRLARILLLDQFTRHIFRDRAEAFAHDTKAQTLTLEGIEAGHDQTLDRFERMFFYMPLEHAEDLALQERSVALFEYLLSCSPESERAEFADFLSWAIRHRDTIARFGRFPHRNRILGRISTAEEIAFLAEKKGFL